jgi:hypothetical protein
MRSKRLIMAGAILVLCSGCLWPFNSKKPSSNSNHPSAISIDLVKPEQFVKSGKLVFIPFTAGADAEAGQSLDRLSLMILKGASEAFQGGSSSIQMIDQGDPDAADMVLDGHITEYRSPRRKFTGIGKEPGVLAFEAELRGRRSDEVLARISGRREFLDNKKVEALAYDIGSAIAEQLIREGGRP